MKTLFTPPKEMSKAIFTLTLSGAGEGKASVRNTRDDSEIQLKESSLSPRTLTSGIVNVDERGYFVEVCGEFKIQEV